MNGIFLFLRVSTVRPEPVEGDLLRKLFVFLALRRGFGIAKNI